MIYTTEPMGMDHKDEVLHIFNHYVLTSTAAYRSQPVDDDFMHHFMAGPETHSSYVIKNEAGAIVGFCMLELFKPIATFAQVAEVTYFVHPDHTGKGIGSLALAKLEEDAAGRGIKTLVAEVSSDNEGSLQFHKQHGFSEYGRLPNVGRKLHKQFGIVYLLKRLD